MLIRHFINERGTGPNKLSQRRLGVLLGTEEKNGLKVAEHSFVGGQRVTRVTARVINLTNKHGGEKRNGTQKTISQNLLIF